MKRYLRFHRWLYRWKVHKMGHISFVSFLHLMFSTKSYFGGLLTAIVSVVHKVLRLHRCHEVPTSVSIVHFTPTRQNCSEISFMFKQTQQATLEDFEVTFWNAHYMFTVPIYYSFTTPTEKVMHYRPEVKSIRDQK